MQPMTGLEVAPEPCFSTGQRWCVCTRNVSESCCLDRKALLLARVLYVGTSSWVHSTGSCLSYCLMRHVSERCQVPRVDEETVSREGQVLRRRPED